MHLNPGTQPRSHSLSMVGLSGAKAASSQLGFLTQLCFIFNDIGVSHLPSPTSLCAINKLQGLELTEPLFQQPPRVTLSYGLVPQGDWPKLRLQYLLEWNRKSALCIAICTSKQGNPYQYVWPKLEGHQQCL